MVQCASPITDVFVMHYLEVTTYGLHAEIGVNGVPLVTDEIGEGLQTMMPVNEFLRRGPNVLTARIDLPPGAAEAGVPDAEIVAKLCLADPTAVGRPKAATVLAEFRWPSSGLPEQSVLPRTFSEPFDLPNAPDLRLWSESEALQELTSSDKDDIVSVVECFREAIVAGKHEDAYALTEIKFEDEIRANGGDPEQLRSTVMEQFGWLSTQASGDSDRVTSANREFHVCGDNRMVHVAQPDSPNAFDIIGAAGMKASVRVYVARVSGEWAIVR